MRKKLNSMRLLESHGISYEALYFPDTVHSAREVALHLDLPASQVYKTLVVVLPQGGYGLVMIAGDHEINLRQLAKAVGVKKLRMATQKEAEACTGLQVGGISALAVRERGFAVYIDSAAAALDTVLVSAGQRGVNVRLAVSDLVRITAAIFVESTASGATIDCRTARKNAGVNRA